MFHAARPLSSRAARPSCSLVVLAGRRYYAISVQPPKIWPGKPEPRVFDERKTYLYNQFTSLLNRASSQPILFLHHKNFKANAMVKLRREVAAAGLPKGTQFSLLDIPPDPDSLPRLSVMHTSIFGVALRNYAPLDREGIDHIAKMAGRGSFAVVTLPSLDPPMLQGVLRALERAVPVKKKEQAPAKDVKKKSDEDEGFVPGRRLKRHKPMLNPELALAGALIEGRIFEVEQVKDVSKLPTLETLRQQIVGLISSPAMQLAMVLEEARGGRLTRTLEGLKKALEDGQSPKDEVNSAP